MERKSELERVKGRESQSKIEIQCKKQVKDRVREKDKDRIRERNKEREREVRERERERVNRKFNFDTFSAESDFLSNVEQVNATWWDQPCKRFFDQI